jgi:gluconolactonase
MTTRARSAIGTLRQVATGFGLIEGPVWFRGCLYFADAADGGVLRLSSDGALTTVIRHRRGIGGMVRHVEGGFVVSGRNVVRKTAQGRRDVLLEAGELDTGFNDLTTDQWGRVYVGALGSKVFEVDGDGFRTFGDSSPIRPGRLYRVNTDATVDIINDNVMVTNGLAFSPDHRRLYHAESDTRTLLAYDVDGDGNVGSPTRFFELPEGMPDGIAVSDDGDVWIAGLYAARVYVVSPDGDLRSTLEVPQPLVTNVCFGGDDMTTLFVTTGSSPEGAHKGSIYSCAVGARGTRVPVARVRLG